MAHQQGYPAYPSQAYPPAYHAFDVEGRGAADASADVTTARGKLLVLPPYKSRPWRSGWHWRRVLMALLYVALLASFATYLYFRIRYTLVQARNPGDPGPRTAYVLSAYSIAVLVVEVLCMAAMALYAVNKTYYPAKSWQPPSPLSVRGPFRTAVCVCCYKEPTATVANTLAAAAVAIREARNAGLVAPGTAVWLCDDTPADRPKLPGDPVKPEPPKECCYTVGGQAVQHTGSRRANRADMVAWLRWAFPDVTFVHRLPDAPQRRAEHNGLNKKSGNLNAALREIWPAGQPVGDRDVLAVLDADQAAFPDMLTRLLPCLDAGLASDNVALVQSPQVFEGVHPIYDCWNHRNSQFWSTMMVAYNSTGFISCAGTNFVVRAAALRALGPAPFPTHTVTEDFALGLRLRAHTPPFAGIYLPLQLAAGTAPDTIRAAFKQRSRWTKGPFQMLASSESPFWFSAPAGAEPAHSLSIRDRVGFVAPVFNCLVNAIATPLYCIVPCLFIWLGIFPAALTLPAIVAACAAMGLTFLFKYVSRPAVGVRGVRRAADGTAQIVRGQVQRRKYSLASTVLQEWNADVQVRCFWALYGKAALNSLLRCCGCRRQAGFSATVGGGGGLFDGFLDILPLALLWFALAASVTWAALQLYVGARLLGPLGICMAWALYQAIPPFAAMLYVLCRVRHAPKKRGCCWCYEHAGRAIFSFLYTASFLASWACLAFAAVLAVKTFPRFTAFTQHSRTFLADGRPVTYTYWYSASDTIRLLKHNLNGNVPWQWHW